MSTVFVANGQGTTHIDTRKPLKIPLFVSVASRNRSTDTFIRLVSAPLLLDSIRAWYIFRLDARQNGHVNLQLVDLISHSLSHIYYTSQTKYPQQVFRPDRNERARRVAHTHSTFYWKREENRKLKVEQMMMGWQTTTDCIFSVFKNKIKTKKKFETIFFTFQKQNKKPKKKIQNYFRTVLGVCILCASGVSFYFFNFFFYFARDYCV